MSVYVNRVLNLKKIKIIGFDMDHTIIRYHTKDFEALTYRIVIDKLIKNLNYPEVLQKLTFEFDRVIQGLMIDTDEGNIIKISRFGKVKRACHGSQVLDFGVQNKIYSNVAIDPRDKHIVPLDTSFSLAHGILYSQLVDLKSQGESLPSYKKMTEDLQTMLDDAHGEGSLKKEVAKNLKKYIIQDPEVVELLEKLKNNKKKLMVITNSDFHYTKLLLDYAITPFLKKHDHWTDLFDVVVTLASKPDFFMSNARFLRIDPQSGLMSNHSGPVTKGVFQGGSGGKLQRDFNMSGEEILYVGDHIYGDVVALKKRCNWRTALVVAPLENEIKSLESSRKVQIKIDELMEKKKKIEVSFQVSEKKEGQSSLLFKEKISCIEKIDAEISKLIMRYQKFYNPCWGELMRAGQEESFFADQVERYACIYMAKITDLLSYSTRSYFRPARRPMAHEIFLAIT